jgi:hypothetical protein
VKRAWRLNLFVFLPRAFVLFSIRASRVIVSLELVELVRARHLCLWCFRCLSIALAHCAIRWGGVCVSQDGYNQTSS